MESLHFIAAVTGNIGGKGIKNNSYMWVYGDRKYSDVVRNRWTPETANTATYPRLTTQAATITSALPISGFIVLVV